MPCPERGFILEVGSGEPLDPGERERFDRHLSSCPSCAEAAAELRRDQEEIARALSPYRAAAPAWKEIEGRLPAPLLPPSWGDRTIRLGFLVRMAAAVLLVGLLGFGYMGHEARSTLRQVAARDAAILTLRALHLREVQAHFKRKPDGFPKFVTLPGQEWALASELPLSRVAEEGATEKPGPSGPAGGPAPFARAAASGKPLPLVSAKRVAGGRFAHYFFADEKRDLSIFQELPPEKKTWNPDFEIAAWSSPPPPGPEPVVTDLFRNPYKVRWAAVPGPSGWKIRGLLLSGGENPGPEDDEEKAAETDAERRAVIALVLGKKGALAPDASRRGGSEGGPPRFLASLSHSLAWGDLDRLALSLTELSVAAGGAGREVAPVLFHFWPEPFKPGGVVDLSPSFKDPWNTPYRYTPNPDGTIEFRSAGPDRAFGTADDAATKG